MRSNLIFLYPLILFLYSIYTFTQVDPNLVLSSNPTYWNFQQLMWQIGYHNRYLSTLFFALLMVSLFAVYFIIINQSEHIPTKRQLLLLGFSILSLLPSYPALSHDIFNYLFNAKMVVQYGANPHIQAAINFPQDPWLDIMHNVHTPAPYGYGWTLFSLLPYFLSQGHLQTGMLIFRLTMTGFFISSLWLITQLKPNISRKHMAMLAFNPLLLIEVLSNIHNDIIMMASLLAAIYVWKNAGKKMALYIASILLFIFSVSIKYVSVVLLSVPVISSIWKRTSPTSVAALVLLMPLLTNQSQRFLPWYLTWSLIFLPFIQNVILKNTLIAASLAGLLSYVLILYYGEYTPQLLLQRSIILFFIPTLVAIVTFFHNRAHV